MILRLKPYEGKLRHNMGDDTWEVYHGGKWVEYDDKYLEDLENEENKGGDND